MVSICLLGGAGEIGGNKILLHEKEWAILLDFGLSLKKRREYEIGYGFERTNRILKNYLLVGILPKINGIYREDLMLDEGLISSERAFSIDCCIVSHGHLDHYGAVTFLKMETPIAVSKSMKALIEHAIETSGRSGIDREIFIYKDRKKEELRKKTGKEEVEEVERPLIIFEEDKKIRGAPIEILPIPVDHSIPATFGFRIETSKASIAYTSDIRFHGIVSTYTQDFVENVKGIDVLLVEGTRINDSTTKSEDDVKKEVVSETLKKKEKLITVLVSSLDIDRIRTLIEAAEECDRIPVLSPRIYHLIKTLHEVESKVKLPKLENAKIYFEKRSIIDEGYFLGSPHYRGWVKKIYESLSGTDKLIKSEEISKDQDEFFLIFNSHQCLFELAEIQPIPGSLFIESTSEPHDEEQEIEWEKVERWINLLRLDTRRIHASGHANREDLLKLVKEIGPKIVIPIHTENPREFKRLLEKEDIKVEIMYEGEEVNIGQ
ncbi:MAG: MBL fold metallo-hydrolase [Nitrososphaerota archaeon]